MSDPYPARLIQLTTDGRDGDVFPLLGSRVDMGRAPQNDIPVNDPLVHRRNCQLSWRNGTWWIMDFHSVNATLLNGRDFTESPLNAGDVITLGETRFRFEVG